MDINDWTYRAMTHLRKQCQYWESNDKRKKSNDRNKRATTVLREQWQNWKSNDRTDRAMTDLWKCIEKAMTKLKEQWQNWESNESTEKAMIELREQWQNWQSNDITKRALTILSDWQKTRDGLNDSFFLPADKIHYMKMTANSKVWMPNTIFR